MRAERSCVVVGSGPNGLAAAIEMARAGWHVTVLEAEATVGGGTRSAELTLPGFVHDSCSAIHPLAVASPFFRSLSLGEFGLEWITPPSPLAHPLDDGSAVMLHASLAETAATLGVDGAAWNRIFAPLVADCEPLLAATLAPLVPPRHPLTLARFGLNGVRSARGLARQRFRSERARALFAGLAAHSVLPLEAPFSASFALMLGFLAHRFNWPFPRGGAGAIGRALAGCLESLGGEIVTSHRVTSPADIPTAPITLFDISPKQLVRIAGDRLPAGYRHGLEAFRYGPAAYKVDWALNGPVPWRASECVRAGTVHVGGTLEEIAASERAATNGDLCERPFVLLAQPSLFDPSRAPPGKHTAWAYCHVPNGSTNDMTARIERQVERFAPGFRDLILARHVTSPRELELSNANYVGGDVTGGSNDWWQLLARPVARLNPYATAVPGWYLCSASTPPGGGVHGMAGFHAARAALRASR